MALIRYPGSKEKLADAIWGKFPDQMKHTLWSSAKRWEYREPFFGAGAIGFRVLRHLANHCPVWLNDIDPGMSSLWGAVRDDPDGLIRFVHECDLTPELFHRLKEEDGRRDLPPVEIAFRKLALHRMSFSGLGAKAGGPIGGKNQGNARYKIGCRWTPEKIKNDIRKYSRLLNWFDDFRFTTIDFADLIRDAPRECFIYADPPYYEKGPALYKHAMSDADHVRLMELLRDTSATWVLSYDDHPFIRSLYSWATIEEIEIRYTMASTDKKRPKNREVIITP